MKRVSGLVSMGGDFVPVTRGNRVFGGGRQSKEFRETPPARLGEPTGADRMPGTTHRDPEEIRQVLVRALVTGGGGAVVDYGLGTDLPVPCMDVRSSAGGRGKITES